MDRLERELEPGERVLWEGRPVTYPVSIAALITYVALVAFLSLIAVTTYTQLAQSTVKTELTWYGAITFSSSVSNAHIGGGGIDSGIDGIPHFHYYSHSESVPNPGFVVFACAFIELVRVSLWRAQRLAITDQRILRLSFGRMRWLPRAGATGKVEKRDLVVRNGDRTLRLPGLLDPEAALSALGSLAALGPA